VRHMIDAMQFLVTLVMGVGLVWAVVAWKSRRREAVLVAVACALQLAVRLVWIPAVRLVFGEMSWASGSAARSFILTGTALGHLSLAVSLGLLVYAALTRRP
jgi:hypothetical protein